MPPLSEAHQTPSFSDLHPEPSSAAKRPTGNVCPRVQSLDKDGTLSLRMERAAPRGDTFFPLGVFDGLLDREFYFVGFKLHAGN